MKPNEVSHEDFNCLDKDRALLLNRQASFQLLRNRDEPPCLSVMFVFINPCTILQGLCVLVTRLSTGGSWVVFGCLGGARDFLCFVFIASGLFNGREKKSFSDVSVAVPWHLEEVFSSVGNWCHASGGLSSTIQ